VLLPFYQKTRTFPIRGIGPNKFTCDVGFIGHYEDDGRHLLFEEMIANGIKLGIWGPNWKKAPNYKKLCFLMQRDITEITSEYNLAINSCKIAMAIYSRLNRDCYTRRSFEIPSTAVCMLSERTAAMERMFAEGREAVYFDRSGESHKVIRALLNEPARIKAIGKAGLNALLRGGHEASDRASEIVELISALKA
jgi:spore maturation protein CgeB